ncbi:hypothetical protein E4U39_006259 [Claviceps sp. Clav50 group G5]|nr:hypothetical protein E4U39_006259 [Claviceps sp. Clav50 group G5]
MYEPNDSHPDPRPQRHRTRTKRKPPKHKRAAASLGGVTLRLAAMQLPATTTAHLFPYTPTQILAPSACWNPSTCHGADLAYIFSQTDSGSVQFSALNYSSTLGAEDSQLTTLTTELPFLKDEPSTTAFGAARTSDGTIIVYSGACDGDIGSIWTYSTSPGDPRSGTWTNKTITTTASASSTSSSSSRSSSTTDTGGSGPAFLGGTIAFSTKLAPSMDQPTLYTYGGMCSPPGPNATTWQTSANYTTKMMSLAPPNTSSQLSRSEDATAAAAYSLRVASTGGPRIPIAGFTLTQLPVSTTNISGSVTQQAGYVLLGGHTQEAFVNMSTAAVWNLPEESWSYVNVGGPADLTSSAAEMMIMRGDDGDDGDDDGQLRGRAAVQIDSRSGHTAVLAEDGASVVVLGGWVGDVDTPAEPQLVVLRLSQTYSSWRWEVPRAQPGGRGVYGHGAAMLPGNVMMVYGGWETSAPGGTTTRKAKRQAFGAGGGALRFFNVTSSSWSNSYTNPASGSAASGGGGGGGGGGDDDGGDGKGAHKVPPKSSDNDDSERKKRLELGLGLGLGLALLLGVVVAVCLWRARRKRRRGAQDEAIHSMTRNAQYSINNADEMMERDDMYPWHPTSDLSPLGYEALRGARSSLDDSGPYRPAAIARKPVPSRNTRGGDEEDDYDGEGRAGYMPDARLNALYSTPGRIHPIMEDDEEDHQDIQALHRGHHPGEPLTPTSDAQSDPFITPTATAPPVVFPPTIITPGGTRRGGPAAPNRTSAGPAPEEHRYYDPDVQEWVSDVNAADSLLEQYNSSRKSRGPLSPTRRASVRSTALRDDESRSGSNLSDANRSSADESLRRSASHRRSGVPGSGGGSGLGVGVGLGLLIDHPKPSSSSTSSYNTARTGFATLQAEGPALLQPPGAAAASQSQSQSQGGPTSSPNPNAQGQGGLLNRRAEEQEPLHHEEEAPSSPSKSKPRRSWLGSLSRVFSQSGGGSSRRVASTASASERDREADLFRDTDFLGGGGGGGDYEPRGGELRGELLRRKQGRQDWDWEGEGVGDAQMHTQTQMAAQRDASLAAGVGAGAGAGTGAAGESENDWDTEIERAVERRLVQVMFTVPKEKLRVVNGGEEEEDLDDGEGGQRAQQQHEKQQGVREPERELLTNRAQVQVQRTDGGIAAAQSAELVDPEAEKRALSLPVQDEKEKTKEMEKEKEKEKEKENRDENEDKEKRENKEEKEEERDEDDESSQGRMSHSTDDWDKRSSGAIFVAEAVRFERVRGRVLRMVESIEKEKEKEKEGSSREGSIKSGKSGKSAKSGRGRDG